MNPPTDSAEFAEDELHRMVAADPRSVSTPDLPLLLGAGRRRLARRRAAVGTAVLAVGAAVVVPAVLLGGGNGRAADPTPPVAAAPSTPAAPAPSTDACGVISCVDTSGDSVTREQGPTIAELPVGALPGGDEELVFVVKEKGTDVLKAGYRAGGALFSSWWALQPGRSNPHFAYNIGRVNAPEGSGGRYEVIGFVPGTPETVTWSAPDGSTGAVDGMKAVGDYTMFYLSRPLPKGYEPPPQLTVERNDDGSITFRREDGKEETIGPDDPRPAWTMKRGTRFDPELTITTSDGWSCTLARCGSTG